MDQPPPSIPEYELLRCIGRGSYGSVWLARSVTGAYRAVKVVYQDQFEDERPYEREFEGIKRFEPISRSHESQMDILQVGRNDQSGYFYYVMELADDACSGEPLLSSISVGQYLPKTLARVLHARQRLPVNEALPIAISLAEGLAHLHEQGLVHRDIKPSNIIFVGGLAKLADIGLITFTDATRSFVGTQGFVPPEGPGTPRADIFGLGKVIYEICTGRDRMDFPSLPEDLETLPDRAELGELNEILLKACDPDIACRYSSASDLKSDLELVRAQRSVRRLRSLERTVRRGRRVIGVATLAALIVGFGWFQSHRFNRMASSQLAHVYVKNGQERLEQNDWFGALPWFSRAMDLETGLRDREAAHLLRIANTLEWCPQLTALYTHSRPVRYAFFDGDARRVLLCDSGETAQIWDPETDQPLGPALVHGGQPFLAVFSPNGNRVATLSRGDGAARLWDVRTGLALGSAMFHGKQAAALCFSPDGRWLATAGEDGLIRIRVADDGSETGLVLNHGAPISALAFGRDSRRLLSLGAEQNAKGYVCLWDTGSGKRIGEPLKESDSINAAQFSPDGDALVTGTLSGHICLRTVDSSWSVRWRQSIDRPIIRLAFNRDGTRLLVASDWSARLLQTDTGEPIGPLIQSAGMLRAADFDSTGARFILAGESRTAMIYDSQTGRPQIPVIKHGGEVYKAFFLGQDSGWITASADGTVRRWMPCRGDHDRAVLSHSRTVSQLLATPNSRFVLTIDSDGVIRKWPLVSGAANPEIVLPLVCPTTAAGLSSDGSHILVATVDSRLLVLSVEDCKVVHEMPAPSNSVQRVVPSPAQNKAALCLRDGSVWLWDWKSGSTEPLPVIRTVAGPQAVFSPDGQTLAIAWGREAFMFNSVALDSRKVVRIQHNDRIWHIGFETGGAKLLASSEDRIMRWWDPETGSSLSPPIHGDGGISFAEFSADQQRVFTSGANYDAMVWNTTTGRPLTPPFKPRVGLKDATFSPDDRWLITTSSDGTLQVWDSSSGEAVSPPLVALGPISFCRFSPDGRWIITVEDGKTVVCRPFLVEGGSRERATAEATLLAGYRVDNHGLLVPLDANESARLAKGVIVNSHAER
ncbi:MAG TPA: WD40 repeat domain-containing serine/threonine-protein kinase [Patescibacteria group bacterium]|nr:WD40 repeat domain-containing serine/threonine-protein kinase [Patescibacteria group bacterium]